MKSISVREIKADEIYHFQYSDSYYCLVKITADGTCEGKGIKVSTKSHDSQYISKNSFSAHSKIVEATEDEKNWVQQCIDKETFIPIKERTPLIQNSYEIY